jgi:hypothetical protein
LPGFSLRPEGCFGRTKNNMSLKNSRGVFGDVGQASRLPCGAQRAPQARRPTVEGASCSRQASETLALRPNQASGTLALLFQRLRSGHDFSKCQEGIWDWNFSPRGRPGLPPRGMAGPAGRGFFKMLFHC